MAFTTKMTNMIISAR